MKKGDENSDDSKKSINYRILLGEMLVYLFLFGMLEVIKEYYKFETKYLFAMYILVGVSGVILITKN